MIPAGYAVMVLDDRGTGASGGQWDSWGARTQQDYQEVLDWIQRQPWSNGSVGDYGGSYMAITSLLVAEADARARGRGQAAGGEGGVGGCADGRRLSGRDFPRRCCRFWLHPVVAGADDGGLATRLPRLWSAIPTSALNTYPGHLADTFQFAGEKLLSAADRRR